jgi:hypothetical protein
MKVRTLLTASLLFGALLPLSAATYTRSYVGSSSSDLDYDFWEKNYAVQGLAGAVQFNNLEFKMQDAEGTKEVDLSLIPQIGGAWSTLPRGNRWVQFGLETTLLFGFQADDINYLVAGGNGLHVSVDVSMWMVDFSGGAYLNCFIGRNRNLRAYLAAGPQLIYAEYDAQRDYDSDAWDDEEDEESAFGVGAYARAGLEFRLYAYGMLGAGVRANWADLDFTDVGGSSDLTGLGGYVTFTAGF